MLLELHQLLTFWYFAELLMLSVVTEHHVLTLHLQSFCHQGQPAIPVLLMMRYYQFPQPLEDPP